MFNSMNLYKYRSGEKELFKRDLESLKENSYWAAEIQTLNDPCESLINTANYFDTLDLLEMSLQNIVKDFNVDIIRTKMNALLKKVLSVGVYSLSKNYEDELMWSHYASAHHGFCIGYNMHYFERSLERYFYNVLNVDYAEHPPEIKLMEQYLSKDDTLGMRQLIATKSLRWKNEQEVRIVTDKPGKHYYDYRSVDAIYFGLRMSDDHKDLMMNSLKGRNIKYYQMNMLPSEYKFTALPLTDIYATAEKYKYSVAPVECAVDKENVQEEFKKYADYLDKAVEVARREPYCLKVILAGFSFTCPIDNPVIYVHCSRSDKDYSNYEYTLDEIDKEYALIEDLEH